MTKSADFHPSVVRAFLSHTAVRNAVLAALLVAFVLLDSASAAPRRGAPTEPPGASADAPALQQPLDPAAIDHALVAAALFHETNRVRRRHKLPLLKWNSDLQRAADLQAGSVALKRVADHGHLLPSLATPYDRVRHVGLNPGLVGENAALLPPVNIPPEHGLSISRRNDRLVYLDGLSGEPAPPHTYATFATAALEAWMNSPPHRAALVNPDFRYVACSARSTRLISGAEMIGSVQVFYTPR